uniref:Uncharacterized protein n=1 Tax=Haptolina brevifila TaxID=156173 RepID=A0A7S2G670_9EUKA|mmetsp:Transcript_28915/g.58190  ORF Transcript_28915/g.58190 Transcript_28915/m.58190 type:complete len:137 (+) Transcript_28915:128-538(+)
MPLDVFSVKENRIHEENIKKEQGLAEAWWTRHRGNQERKLSIAIGARPDKEPVIMPEMPRLALGKAAARPLSSTFGKTSTARESDLESISSELRDWMRESGHFARRPYHRQAMPNYYGRSLHSSSSDGTDWSTRKG